MTRLLPSLADVRAEFEPHGWQVDPAQFCYLAFRRPTPTSEEVLTAPTLSQLTAKLRAAADEEPAELAAGTGGISLEEARRRPAEAREAWPPPPPRRHPRW
jgi:hypothetical protein